MTGVSSFDDASAAVAVDAAFVVRLAATDPSTLDAAGLVRRSADLARASAWLTSLQHANDVELARRPFRASHHEDPAEFAAPGDVVRDGVADELAVTERCSARTAQHRIDVAVALIGLPETRARLRTGRIDLARARVLVAETRCLDDAKRRGIDARWAERAECLTPTRLRRGVRRAVIALAPKAAKVRESQAHDERRVVVSPAEDGMAELWALLPAVDAVRAFDVLTAAARHQRHSDALARVGSSDEEEPTLDQRRADLFADVFRAAAVSGELPGGASIGAGVEIQVHAHATSLLGLDDEPALLAGYGPITAQAVRELAPSSRLRRLLTDPVTGKVLDVGAASYKPTADIARHVRAAHPRCTFPSCEQPARRSELDHVLPFPLGPTSAENLRPRCKRHHLLKHHPLVHVEELPDGTTRWHLPTGTHDHAPEPPLPPPEPESPPDGPPN